jgi:hypothetical protein
MVQGPQSLEAIDGTGFRNLIGPRAEKWLLETDRLLSLVKNFAKTLKCFDRVAKTVAAGEEEKATRDERPNDQR